jgi:hypothetical protein
LRKELFIDFNEALEKTKENIRSARKDAFRTITCSVSNPFGQSLRNPLCHCLISFSVTVKEF